MSALYQTRRWSLTELGRRVHISRKTGDTWLRRSSQEGCSGLQEKRRAPLSCPHRITPEVAAMLLEAKHLHPSWGPRKILPSVARHHPALEVPAASSAGELCRHAGLSRATPRRRRPQHPGAPTLHAGAPTEGWTADVTGPCRTGDGVSGDPRPVADAYSRSLRGCTARRSTTQGAAPPVFAPLGHEYGRPEAMRTDHGAPFATPAFCGLSKRRVWGITLGIRQQRIAPGRPEQNGRHARRPRPRNADATRPPAQNHATQPARCDRCCRAYHHERPHEALGQRPPAARYHAAPRRMPAPRAAPESPGHCVGRRVRNAGTCRLPRRQRFRSDPWLQAWLAREETGDGSWSISCSDVLLARVDERNVKLRA